MNCTYQLWLNEILAVSFVHNATTVTEKMLFIYTHNKLEIACV